MNKIIKKNENIIDRSLNNILLNNTKMDLTTDNLSKLKKSELLTKCQKMCLSKYSSKNKNELINLIIQKNKESSDKIYKQNNTNTSSINITKQNNIYTFIDLFCGIGGFHQAMLTLNSKCVFACDIDENCRSIYEKNYGIKTAGDITEVKIEKIPTFDILCAGFPCQPFSKAGFQKGFNDDRGNLFFNICNIIKFHNPKYLLLENVRNLSSHDNGNTWNVIYKYIDELGYYTYTNPVILNVLHFNIPQNRERVIIMCKRKDLGVLQKLPIISSNPKKQLTCYIEHFINKNEILFNNKYKITGKMKDVEQIWDIFIKLLISNEISIPKFPIWTDWWDNDLDSNKPFYMKYKSWIDKNRSFYVTNKKILKSWLSTSRKCENWIGAVRKFEWQAGDSLQEDGMHNVLWSARGSGIRVKRLDYIPTLVAMSMVPIYGPESRKLTSKELLRLQSFPDTFQYNEKHIYKQLGNAVNVKMIEKCLHFLIFNDPLFLQ
jgi:DNA (cytosine-5)-methyltransferase 1